MENYVGRIRKDNRFIIEPPGMASKRRSPLFL